MATCEAERRNQMAAYQLRNGLGSGFIDVSTVLATLEGDGECCTSDK